MHIVRFSQLHFGSINTDQKNFAAENIRANNGNICRHGITVPYMHIKRQQNTVWKTYDCKNGQFKSILLAASFVNLELILLRVIAIVLLTLVNRAARSPIGRCSSHLVNATYFPDEAVLALTA